ncbi:MAG: aminoglycoside phosphotransferase family protein, partial [Actinomycetota bacterium]|nr:aminoglycoside phosphotransferase family protein [Actinomycetota bacterium]
MLAQEDVARYLLERGLLGPEAVLDGDLAIRDVSSRNRNYRVETRDGPCYLLKQGLSPEAGLTVAHEASIYHRFSREHDALSPYVPRFCGYDGGNGVLALELVRDAEDMRTMHLRTGQFSAGPAAALGAALGTLHRCTQAEASAGVPGYPPWVLWVHRPDARVFRDISAAGLELIRIVQSAPGVGGALDHLRASWSQGALVHGDVKWDNCLVLSRDDGGDEIRLVDWEGAMPGDPGWDIGSALSHYLSFWIFSIPVTGTMPPERFPELATFQLDTMKPALSACWIAYADAAGLTASASAELLSRAVQ